MSTITYNLLSFLSQLLHLPITKGLILGISVPGGQVGHGGHIVFREAFPPGCPALGFGVTFPPPGFLATQVWIYRTPTKNKMSSDI